MDEDQLRVADANDVARLQRPVAVDQLVADHRAVAAVQVAERPLPARHEHFGVVAAAALVLDDDLVGRRTADRDRLAGHQPEHVAPLRSFADHQISQVADTGGLVWTSRLAPDYGTCKPELSQMTVAGFLVTLKVAQFAIDGTALHKGIMLVHKRQPPSPVRQNGTATAWRTIVNMLANFSP